MGIKGIYGEIVGERVALSKLAAERFVETGRPFRVAVDISIWQYQVQSSKGGTNPALRTFYHRLVRLLSLSIQPLFVFDGPHKPPFKRGRRTSANTVSLPNFLMKQLLKLFGFSFVVARGEAEAEAALLQREGIVDAVFSEDVDTLMFGCGLTMRNWSSEGSRGDKTPTHVTIYDASKTAVRPLGLDREGMVLVALMSGGDYIPEGIPGCGIKVACEAARAGFGKSLLNIAETDTVGFKTWRDSLAHELRTNASKFFRVKHNALQLPETFPNQEVLGYYAQPMVSSPERIQKLKDEIQWDGVIDIVGLAPALLVWKLRTRGLITLAGDQSVSNKAEEESVVKSLSGKRTHFTTDGIPEVGVNYLPTDIVELDLDAEEQGNEAIEDIEPKVLEPDLTGGTEFPTALPATGFDPTKRQKIWVWEGYVRMGVPLMFHDWEENLRDRGKGAPSKTAERRKGRPVTKTGMKAGALEPFLKPMKPGMSSSRAGKPDRADRPSTPAFIDPVSKTRNRLFEELDIQKASEKPKSGNLRVKGKENRTRAASPIASATHSRSRRTNPGVFPNEDHFILAKRPPNAPSVPLPPESRSLVLDKYNPSKGVSDPRRERCSNREEPKCANGDRNLASLKGSCGAFRGYRSPSLREPFSVGSGSSRKCSPPNLEHIEDGPSGSTTNRPSQSKEKAPTKHRSGPTIENCIDLSESPPPRPPSGHRASYLVTSHFEGNGPTSALAESELNRRPDFHPSTEIFPAEDQPASSPSTPLIPTPQPRNPPQRPKAKFPPTPSPPPSCLGLSQSNRETSSVQISGLGSQTTVAKVVRMVAPRESLAGAWKEVDELESRTRSNVFVRVEVLDMTDDGL